MSLIKAILVEQQGKHLVGMDIREKERSTVGDSEYIQLMRSFALRTRKEIQHWLEGKWNYKRILFVCLFYCFVFSY